jgi:hypothetical protein
MAERATAVRELEDPLVGSPDREDEVQAQIRDVALEVLCGPKSARLPLRDGTRRFSPKRRTGLHEHLLRGDAGDLAGFDLVESARGLLEPDLLGVAVGLRIEAGNEALGEPSALVPVRNLIVALFRAEEGP